MSSALSVVCTGKHCGATYAGVAERDRSYSHWVMNTSSLPRSLSGLRTWLVQTHGGVLCIGKHRGAFFSEIYRDHPEYTIWVCELDDPSPALKDYQEYVRKREAEAVNAQVEPKQPTPKRARGPRKTEPVATATSSMECKVCFDRSIDALLLPCKHLVCCQTCAVQSRTCPVCRGRVDEILRVYPG